MKTVSLISLVVFSTLFPCLLLGKTSSPAAGLPQKRIAIQSVNSDSLIDASQAGASPLLFQIDMQSAVIKPHEFSNPKEFYVRGGIPNFIAKAKNKSALTIGYFGGSITRGDYLYRMQSARYIQNMFPDARMVGVNAGVSGTGTDLGACRLKEQILKYNPDLVFVEFAVNGGPNEAMEGIIRQIRQYNPAIDICLLYTATSAGTASYVAGNVPLNIANLEKIAVHYNIPSIHLALQPALLESQGLLLWKAAAGTVTTKIIFSNDGVHPTTAGGDLYAEAIARAMEQLKQTSSVVNYTLPTPLYAENWEDAGMYSPNEIAQFSAGWTQIDPFTRPDFVQFAPWFPYVRSAAAAGEYYTFTFTGKSFGFFDIGGPEVGQVEICVDGQNVTLSATSASQVSNATLIAGSQVATLNRFNVNCNNRYRGQFNIINVPPGTHTVKLSVSPVIPDKATILGAANLADITANPSKYNQHVLYLGKILIRGTVQKNDAGVGQISQSNPKVIASKKQIRISDCQDFNFADLYLSTGRWVQRLNLKQRTTIAVDSGVYFVRIFSDNRQYASKVMVL